MQMIKKEKGISLISLAIAVAVLLILTNVIIYNVRDDLKIGNLKEMQNDIQNLRDKVSDYYMQNGQVPARVEYPNINHLKEAGVISEVSDTGRFLVIDLSVIENLTLNRGADFETIKTWDTLTEEQAKNHTDLYIINETSHNIFYVAGITIDNEIFYTDVEDLDTKPVDLRYVEGVKIPEGFHYTGGTKALGNIFIENEDGTETYKWVVKEEMTEIPSDIEIDSNEKEDFIKSVNSYQGYYKNVNNNTVKYFSLQKWSPVYDKEGMYQDKNGDRAYIPKGFQVSEVPEENVIDKGLVVKDSQNNEWVWIEVPKGIYKTAQSSDDYEKIEKDMQDYVKDYRDENASDTWYSEEQHGFNNEIEYNNWKNSMLKSVYEKGGFYIGRYEAGTETQRTSEAEEMTNPLIQRDKFPYTFVTCYQAQTLAKRLATEEKTSSLMFGIQWDLVLKFIETKGAKTPVELKENATSFGNYNTTTFEVNRGKYTQEPTNASSWNIANNYTKPNGTSVLLTTGATNRNSVLGIYDLTGNISEWTLESNNSIESPCTSRGGSFEDKEGDMPMASRYNTTISHFDNGIGFRPVLW